MENLRCEKAVEKKHNGYNCAQAVACSFCKEASMDEDTLKKITQGFGAGLGTMAGTCGAISGAAVVAGLINQDKAGTSQTVRSVMNQFKL
jgi:C_GCAxxG_C_C family probable redox protein